ncbi:MAG: amidohydrolase family protein [Planctomycetaceae bacterium]
MNPAERNFSLQARLVFPGDRQPLENGVVEIESGRIVELHQIPRPTTVNLGNVAIIPGLINAHTHLEFSGLTEPVPFTPPFTNWIRSVVENRRQRSPSIAGSIQKGLREAALQGATTLGEIATMEPPTEVFTSEITPRTTVFRELIGFQPEQIEQQLQIARNHLENAPDTLIRVTHGLSPHAPYSVHPELFRHLVVLAKERNVPLAMHLAETREELEFLEAGTGPFVEMLQDFGIWQNEVIEPGTRILDYLKTLASLQCGLIIHGNYLDEEELRFLAKNPQLAVIYCPRTHAYFGHLPHPWLQLNALGGTVALGTDSRASNPNLSLWEELVFLHERYPHLGDWQLLRFGTIHGAVALGCHLETGSITPGKSADLAVVSLNSERGSASLFERKNAILRTMIAGNWIPPEE